MTTAPDEGATDQTRASDASPATSAAPLSLRPYQADAIERMRDHARRGHRAICLVLPTGGGKTVVATSIVLSHLSRTMPDGKRPHVLFVAHRTELIAQAAATFRRSGVQRVRTINAGRASGDEYPDVTVASVQTLSGVKWRDNLPDATMLVFDECHHVKASTWLHLATRYASVTRVGLTATPERADGSPLGDIFTAIVEVASTRHLIELGFLTPCDVYGPTDAGTSMAEDPVAAFDKWCTNDDGSTKRTVVFCKSVEYARTVSEQFVQAGIPATCVDGHLSADERSSRLDAFRRGDFRVITNMHLLTEGWDDPGVEACILARRPDHAGTYLQIVGRVLRISPDTGKQRALLIDLCGAWQKHGLPDDEREFNLEGDAISAKEKPERCKQCKQCGYVGSPWREGCPRCGYVAEVKVKPVEVDGREMALVNGLDTSAVSRAKMREYYLAQLAVARARGFKDGWAWFRYRDKYPTGPNFRRPRTKASAAE